MVAQLPKIPALEEVLIPSMYVLSLVLRQALILSILLNGVYSPVYFRITWIILMMLV